VPSEQSGVVLINHVHGLVAGGRTSTSASRSEVQWGSLPCSGRSDPRLLGHQILQEGVLAYRRRQRVSLCRTRTVVVKTRGPRSPACRILHVPNVLLIGVHWVREWVARRGPCARSVEYTGPSRGMYGKFPVCTRRDREAVCCTTKLHYLLVCAR
jgi:hypothetical protein